MPSKAEKTTQYIIETVAPIFNKYGYEGTSLSQLTEATGLTKGALYGNFKNKEALALASFNYVVRKVMWKLADKMNAQPNAPAKLKALTDFYRSDYIRKAHELGGCPMMNVSVDTLHSNSPLHQRVQEVIAKLKKNLANVIEQGKQQGYFRPEIDSARYAARIYAQIQGSLFVAIHTKDAYALDDMMDHIDNMIQTEMNI